MASAAHPVTNIAPALGAQRRVRRSPKAVRYRPDKLLYAVVLLTWTSVWRIQDVIPVLGAIKLPIIAAITAIALFMLDRHPVRKTRWIKSPILTLVLSLLVLMVLGVPGSLWPGKSFIFITRDFIPSILLMVITATSVRTMRDLEWLAFTQLVGAMVYGFLVGWLSPVGADGRLGRLVFYDANDFALLIACSIPFAVYFLRPGVTTKRKIVASLAILMFVVLLLKSGSRGGLLAFVAVMAYVLLRSRAFPVAVRIRTTVIAVALLVLGGSTQYWAMMRTMLNPKDDYNWSGKSYDGRMEIWKRGFGYMAQRPLLGVGVRAFPQAEGRFSEISKVFAARGQGIKWSVAHNSFVEVGAEVGIPALIIFISMFGVTLRTLARVRPRYGRGITEQDAAFAQMLTGSLLGFMVAGFFVSAEYFAELYVLLGFALGLIAVVRRRRSRPMLHAKPPSRRGGVRRGMMPRAQPAALPAPVVTQPLWFPAAPQ